MLWLTLCNPMDCSMPSSLSITNSQSLFRLMSIELVMPSNHLVLCHPLLLPPSIFPSIRVFAKFLTSGGQGIGVSASASVLPKNIQDWFPLGLTGWSPCCPRDSQESSPIPQFKSINYLALNFLYNPTLTYLFSINNFNLLIYRRKNKTEGTRTSSSGWNITRHCSFNLTKNKTLD